MPRKRKSPMTFPQFVAECIRNEYQIIRGPMGRSFSVIGGDGRTVIVYKEESKPPYWTYDVSCPKESVDWDRAARYVHRTLDEKAWEDITKVWSV